MTLQEKAEAKYPIDTTDTKVTGLISDLKIQKQMAFNDAQICRREGYIAGASESGSPKWVKASEDNLPKTKEKVIVKFWYKDYQQEKYAEYMVLETLLRFVKSGNYEVYYLDETPSPSVNEIVKKEKIKLIWDMIMEWQDSRDKDIDINAEQFSAQDIESDLYEWLEKVDPESPKTQPPSVNDRGQENKILKQVWDESQAALKLKYAILEAPEIDDLFRSFYSIASRNGADTNWEAITKRIKVVLDLWKTPNLFPNPNDRIEKLEAALRELLELKDMKDRLENTGEIERAEMGVEEIIIRKQKWADYKKRKPLAWKTARELVTPLPEDKK